MGLDPKQNRLEREAKRSQNNEPPPLNPPFPFKPTPFDPWFFGLQSDLPPVGGQQTPGSD